MRSVKQHATLTNREHPLTSVDAFHLPIALRMMNGTPEYCLTGAIQSVSRLHSPHCMQTLYSLVEVPEGQVFDVELLQSADRGVLLLTGQ